MKRFNFLLLSIIAVITASAQVNVQADYTCSVKWHWGVIDMTAGFGTISINIADDQLSGTLSGHSIPWQGRIYSVSDTLYTSVNPDSETINYINGWYRKPEVNTHTNTNLPKNYRTIDGQGTLSASPETMEAVYVTADMLSLFYYAKILDFDNMVEGQVTTIPISRADGNQDTLQIVYNGTGKCNCGCEEPTYDVTFTYSHNGEPCKYPALCQISQTERVPKLISADIRIGHVEMVIQ